MEIVVNSGAEEVRQKRERLRAPTKTGPTGREILAQGFGRLADALGKNRRTFLRPERPREFCRDQFNSDSAEVLAAFQAALTIYVPDPGHRPTGRSPGLKSPGPLGRSATSFLGALRQGTTINENFVDGTQVGTYLCLPVPE